MKKPFHSMTPIAALLSLSGLAVGCGGVGTAQADLRSAIDARQSTMDECYREALTRDESLTGDLRERVPIAVR